MKCKRNMYKDNRFRALCPFEKRLNVKVKKYRSTALNKGGDNF